MSEKLHINQKEPPSDEGIVYTDVGFEVFEPYYLEMQEGRTQKDLEKNLVKAKEAHEEKRSAKVVDLGWASRRLATLEAKGAA